MNTSQLSEGTTDIFYGLVVSWLMQLATSLSVQRLDSIPVQSMIICGGKNCNETDFSSAYIGLSVPFYQCSTFTHSSQTIYRV
jgi:hypothetical protein